MICMSTCFARQIALGVRLHQVVPQAKAQPTTKRLLQDENKNVQQGVDNLAKIVIAKNAGGIKTEEDARQSTEYKDSKANWIKSMMTDSINVGSMLTDWIGGYTFTQDKSERDNNTRW